MKVRPPLGSFELVRYLIDVVSRQKIEAKSGDRIFEVTPLILRVLRFPNMKIDLRQFSMQFARNRNLACSGPQGMRSAS